MLISAAAVAASVGAGHVVCSRAQQQVSLRRSPHGCCTRLELAAELGPATSIQGHPPGPSPPASLVPPSGTRSHCGAGSPATARVSALPRRGCCCVWRRGRRLPWRPAAAGCSLWPIADSTGPGGGLTGEGAPAARQVHARGQPSGLAGQQHAPCPTVPSLLDSPPPAPPWAAANGAELAAGAAGGRAGFCAAHSASPPNRGGGATGVPEAPLAGRHGPPSY